MPTDKVLRLPSYGGQAVMEGVLMRGKRNVAMAVRASSGEIVTYEEELPNLYRSKWMKIPFIRGVIGLWDSLNLGTRLLTKSANLASGEEKQLEGAALVGTVLLSLVLGVGIFFVLPAFLAGLAEKFLSLTSWWSNMLEGLLRLVILIAYLSIIGRIPEIQRVFSYHGAEHKTINAFEAGVEMTPEVVAQQTIVHPRCGTSFILTLVLLSVLIFTLLGPLPLHWRLISRILMLPLVSGIAYEYIRFAANWMDKSAFVRWLIQPNLWLQKLTTREPSIDMLEVSIKAFNLMLEGENSIAEV
ncbi:MAG: DUF1385 domain-containing protein [Anaerolineaceae bacterium]|jgi:uncharacterized protein YqhQ|nr:DUF1385 domain-containing protein [Anaerolineaceae bacterium]